MDFDLLLQSYFSFMLPLQKPRIIADQTTRPKKWPRFWLCFTARLALLVSYYRKRALVLDRKVDIITAKRIFLSFFLCKRLGGITIRATLAANPDIEGNITQKFNNYTRFGMTKLRFDDRVYCLSGENTMT